MQQGLGNVVPLGADAAANIPEGSPPTSYAAYAVVTGERGALLRFAGFTLLRSLIIAPGVALAGVRGRQLVWGSLAASGVISAAALGYAYASRKMAQPSSADVLQPLPNPPPPTPVDTTGETVSQQPAASTPGVQGAW
jgi:hypothetical protein